MIYTQISVEIVILWLIML